MTREPRGNRNAVGIAITPYNCRLLDTAEHIYAGPGVFQKAGEFPAAESNDLPLSDEARQFCESGKPFFQRHLPFWLAVWMDRLLVLILPVVGVIYPLVQILPTLYNRAMQQGIFLLSGDLRSLEHVIDKHHAGEQGCSDRTSRPAGGES